MPNATSPQALQPDQPLHLQIYERLRALILQGSMAPGSRAPSLRALAVELGVARGTVEAAYDRLVGEGYLVTRGPAGTFVAAHAALATRAAARRETAPQRRGTAAAKTPTLEEAGTPLALQLGLPALDEFPRKLWARLTARQARLEGSLTRPAPAGHPRLREALADYLHRSRGLSARAEQVFIVPGYTAALGLCVDAVLQAGDAAWVECPGYPTSARVLTQLGLKPVPVPVDDDGLDVSTAMRRSPQARLAVVTPSHQSPTGVSMTLARRQALLAWAVGANAWVLEDDYDGEYRYRGHPLPALKSLDLNDRVVYCGTLSKVLFPGLKLAYLVVPQAQQGLFEAASQRALHGGCPDLQQAVAADFILEGHFARHIKRMRTLYAKRRGYLAEALMHQRALPLTVEMREGGMHLLARLPDGSDDLALQQCARQAGFALQALSAWSGGDRRQRGLLLSFTNVASAAQARRLCERLMAALAPA